MTGYTRNRMHTPIIKIENDIYEGISLSNALYETSGNILAECMKV
jgi:hypothetical protein